jgi:hypothetical protein
MTTEQATTQLREFIEARLLTDVRLELPDNSTAQVRVGLVSSMLVGVMVGRRLLQVPTLHEADTEALVELVAPAVQALLAGDRT